MKQSNKTAIALSVVIGVLAVLVLAFATLYFLLLASTVSKGKSDSDCGLPVVQQCILF
jgi:hypothetical protein